MIRNDIRQLAAYQVPDATGLVKLDAMENPHPLPDALRRKWAEHLSQVPVNRYPDADMRELREAIARREGVEPEQVLLGNGSDELIQMALIAADAGACVVPHPTFVMYELISRWLKRPVATVPLGKGFSLAADAFLRVCAREKAAIAFLACPNNPTGNMWPRDTVRQIAGNFRGLLIIDEAYRPFADVTHTDLISPHVIVLRTFSKLGLAGLRAGYALGDADTIEALGKVRLPYNINSLTQASLAFFLEHFDVFEKQAAAIRAERGRMMASLLAIEEVEVFPSQANFLLLRVPDADAAFAGLKARGILVKNLHGTDDLLSQCLRITIGTPEENDRLLTAMKETLA